MAENFSNTSLAKSNSFHKGMIKDVADIFMTEGVWTNAINAINNSHTGESGTLGNEPSNRLCATSSFDIIGFANKKGTEWVLFSTNDSMSEIGIFEESTCTYTTVIRDTCLGFKKTNLITAIVKENYDCTFSVYWQDGLNPDRVMNLDRVPYLCVANNPNDPCAGEDCSTRLDCEAIRLHPAVKQPCIIARRADGAGQLNNGSYMATIAYSENGVRLTDYAMPSNPQSFWSHVGIGGSINITLSDLDPDYNEFELVIIAVVNQQTIAKRIGYYSTNQKQIVLDQILQSLPTVDLSIIPLKSVVYEKSEKMFNINNYLVRSGVTTQPHFNYQPLANLIQSEWMAVQYPRDYYFHGGNKVGYMRDEVYAFFIRWVYDTGARSASYHIPGRASTGSDLLSINPSNDGDIVYSNESQKWQVYDTSDIYNTTGSTDDGGVIINYGPMAYWESTERYPVQPEIWNELCNTPIRHHKMPSNETTHIHDSTGNYINVLGVRFKNIKHPLDENGIPIPNIVGFEILRGSREGNRSIVAKGMFNNMCEYKIQGQSNKLGLYQNYPYNDLNDDYFLTNDPNCIESGSGTPDAVGSSGTDLPGVLTGLVGYVPPLENPAKKNIFSFHSPETNFIKPYLGNNYIKLYTEEIGVVKGEFQLPYKHPKFKFVTDAGFFMATFVAIGVTLLDGMGTTSTSNTFYPSGAGFGAGYSTGARVSGSAAAIPDTISNLTVLIQSATGLTTQGQQYLMALGIWLAQSLYYGQKAVDEIIGIMKSFTKYRNHVLQYNSHGFYSNYRALTNALDATANGAPKSLRRKVSDNLIKYIGSGVQTFDSTYRINNLYRNKFVCLQTDTIVPVPGLSSSINGTMVYEEVTRKRVRDVAELTFKNPFGEFTTLAVSYYGAIKVDYQNQYGQLDSIMQMPIGSCVVLTQPILGETYSTGVMFGGDVYINRYTEKNPYFYFNTWMIDLPNGTEYDYRNYINGPLPRYWMNTADFDAADLGVTVNADFTDFPPDLPSFGSPLIDIVSPSDGHRFDRATVSGPRFIVKNAWMYLFYNGVRDFFTESELNMAFRDYGEPDKDKFYDVYGGSFNDLQYMFRSDVITEPIYYKYDLSLSASKLFNNFASWGSLLPRDYDPTTYDKCFEYYPRRTVYSLQQQEGLKRDNWRNFLPLNYKDFRGKVNNIKALNVTGAIILFEDAEPLSFSGIDQLQTESGVKFTIGDGGLFAQNGQTLVNADDVAEYGTCISSRSAVNTPYGMFYISQKNGRIFNYSGSGLEDISKSGMKFWLNMNLPSTLLKTYPNYPLYDNPVAGIGCQTIYDPTYELLYFTKKDYSPVRNDLHFDDPSGVPYYIDGYTTVPAPTEVPDIVNNIGDCGCPEGSVFIMGECVTTETVPATQDGPFVKLIKNPATNSFLGYHGLRLYTDITSYVYNGTPSFANYKSNLRGWGKSTNPDFVNAFNVKSYNGTGTPPSGPVEPPVPLAYTSSFGTSLWFTRLKEVDIKPETPVLWPQDKPLEMTFCVTINEEKQYLIGCAADDQFEIYLNINGAGEQAVLKMNAFQNGVNTPFELDQLETGVYNFWHVFPITIPAGTHQIKLVGVNGNGVFAVGAEIYDITLTDFINTFITGTPGPLASPNDLEPYIVFSTLDYENQYIPDPSVEIPGTWSCPGGEPVDFCGGANCTITTTVPYTPCLDCNLTSSSLSVQQGGSILLTWNTTGGTVTLNDVPVNASDVQTFIPTTNPTYYTLKVTNGEFVKTCALEVEVTPIPIKSYCNYDNPECFKKCDWTLSYDPKSKMFISFHDWHPNFLMSSSEHFYTIVDSTIWKHNDRWDSYCNYYGTDYPWEVEFPIVTPNNVTTLRNVEYYMEAHKFYNNGKDYFHILDENFDRAIVYNSEQISGLLKLNLKGKNAPLDIITYPIPGSNGIDILYSKEENKYRFYEFYDITKDRGEYSGNREPMWVTDCSGYQKNINPYYVNYAKPAVEHKKFRHYGNKIILRKNVSNDVKMILKLTNSKHLASIR